MRVYDHLTTVVVTGAKRTGKTQLIRGIDGKAYDEQYNPTIGINVIWKNFKRENDKINKFQIWDVSANEEYRSIAKNYYGIANVIVLCVDLSDTDVRIDYLKRIATDLPESANILVAFTKSDSPRGQKLTSDQLTAVSERVMSELSIPAKRQHEHIVTSARKGIDQQATLAALDKAAPQPLFAENVLKNFLERAAQCGTKFYGGKHVSLNGVTYVVQKGVKEALASFDKIGIDDNNAITLEHNTDENKLESHLSNHMKEYAIAHKSLLFRWKRTPDTQKMYQDFEDKNGKQYFQHP